ncbi:transporter [Litchfieldella qijiaojingensis]|uniref:Transporter n=1 Tax=Litchfieldella qijiaojingensis TaxID=980347 RepID=A0ABQ2YZ52_9GAMM|nr:AEC family transporter [Halomonas qijiaojingensis]GGX99567.1 transporter [Halomonas qijiaojingensis]
MPDIFGITLPIFLLVGVGYLAVHIRIIDKPQIRGLGVFVIHCALPALIVRALVSRPLNEIFNPYYLLAYGLGSLVVFLAALFIARRLQRKPLDASALYALGMSASNSGFIGYPVAALVVGSPAVAAMALNFLIENLLVIPAALTLAEVSSQRGASTRVVLIRTIRQLLKNPIIIAILVGTTLALSGLSLPAPLFRAIDMLATAAAPTALFVIGGTLYGLKARGMAGDVTQIAIGKLIAHPLAVLLAFLALPTIDPVLMTTGILFASAPMISVYPIFGQRYGLGEITAATLMVTTLAAFLTISLMIWLLQTSSLFVVS